MVSLSDITEMNRKTFPLAQIASWIDHTCLKAGAHETVLNDMRAVRRVCLKQYVVLKVILETALLTDNEITTACRLAADADVDYVKTSTGFGPGGATIEHVALMKSALRGTGVRIKAPGGIRSLQTALDMIRAGADRIGTSSGVRILGEAGLSGKRQGTESNDESH